MKLRERSFWRLAALIVTINLILMSLVVIFSIETGPRIVAAYPSDGDGGVSTLPTIRVTYRRPLDTETLDNAVRLEPPADGTLEVDDHGFSFQPSHPLRPNTDYHMIVKEGIREIASGVTSKESITSFRTRASRLIELRREGSAWALWAVDPFTEQQQSIVRGWEGNGSDTTPPPVTASPDGNRVAYIVPSASPTWTLWTADLDTGRRRAILQGQPGLVSSVTWSPRGDLIAYAQSDMFEGRTTLPRIWIASPDSAETALVYGRGSESGSAPSWAPDGARLAFHENRLATLIIYSFTGTLQSIRSEVPQVVRWSPDGETLALLGRSQEQRGQAGINLIDLRRPEAAGGFWHEGSQTERSPEWSPDGTSLAYVRLDLPTSGIWVGDVQGLSARPLHQDIGWVYSQPRWSPDGRRLAFTRQPARAGPLEADPELWVVGLDGAPHRLTVGGWLVSWIP